MPGSVRLVNGSTTSEGNVEILYNDTWGSVCDEGWDFNDARVVCRSQGLDDAIIATHNAAFGQGSGPIWLTNLQCSGNESNLLECPHGGSPDNQCSHSDDAGVICTISSKYRK